MRKRFSSFEKGRFSSRIGFGICFRPFERSLCHSSNFGFLCCRSSCVDSIIETNEHDKKARCHVHGRCRHISSYYRFNEEQDGSWTYTRRNNLHRYRCRCLRRNLHQVQYFQTHSVQQSHISWCRHCYFEKYRSSFFCSCSSCLLGYLSFDVEWTNFKFRSDGFISKYRNI